MTRSVFLDPDGTLGDAWMFVVVECTTGVRYVHQFGGTLNREAAVEGYLVPVSDAAVRTRVLMPSFGAGSGEPVSVAGVRR